MKSNHPLWQLGYETLRELETERGVLASGRDEIYGCIFGRDSLITALKLLEVYRKSQDEYFLGVVKKILLNLLDLQGKEVNIESGEEPGKCIHEFRPDKHEHLTKHLDRPWYVYPDSIMRNYDSVDATPLLLIALYEYYSLTKDESFLELVRLHAERAIDWILIYGDTNGDGLIDYRFHPDRNYGGLVTQSWMDSHDSVFHEDGTPIIYPIAPIEAQAYAYVALRAWSKLLYRPGLLERADQLKKVFNEKFIIEDMQPSLFADDGWMWSLAFAVDGVGKPCISPRSSMGHCLWAVYEDEETGELESILDGEYIEKLVKRLMAQDLFTPKAGIRTLSTKSIKFHPMSYHNGSIWPHDTSIIIEGLENFGYTKESERVRKALLHAYRYFRTPIELFAFDGAITEYRSPTGQTACKKQAWSAAALLSETL